MEPRRAPAPSWAATTVVLVIAVVVVIVVAVTLFEPWLRALDRLVEGDGLGLALAVVAWCWLLAVPVHLAVWATRRFGAPGAPTWLLVAAAVGPLLRLGPSRTSSVAETERMVVQVVGHAAPGRTIAVLVFLAGLLTWGLVVWLLRVTRSSSPSRAASWAPAITWTGVWGLLAALVVAAVG